MLAAMILSMGYFAEVMVGRANHIGFSITTLTVDNMLNLIKVTLAIQLTYYGAVSAIKISILCMYLRFCKLPSTLEFIFYLLFPAC